MNITSKYRSLSVQAKAALWFTICSFLQKGISFITVPIFTRLMSTEEYGTYTVYLSWLQILTIMTSLYLFNGVYDNAMAKYEKQRDEYTSAMQGLTLVITGAVFALYCFTSGFWEKILNLPKSMILLMFLEALLSPALSYWSGRQRFEYRYRILVCVTILQALMNPIASLVLIRMNGGTAMMRILGIVGVQICICVPIIVFQFCKGSVSTPLQITINEQISNFAQTYPTNLKASSNEALLFMRRYRFANCSCFSCCFKDAYPSSNVQ